MLLLNLTSCAEELSMCESNLLYCIYNYIYRLYINVIIHWFWYILYTPPPPSSSPDGHDHDHDDRCVWMRYRSASFGVSVYMGQIPYAIIETLTSLTLLFIFMARIPQIYNNYTKKTTGQLSGISQFLMVAGGLARVFTGVTVWYIYWYILCCIVLKTLYIR